MSPDGRFERLFVEMDSGSALHEIIIDDSGTPVNYRFLAVNPAFERLTGLKAREIIGKTVLEVLPGTESHWIETFGNVALTGKPARIENFSGDLGKYYQVTCYSPEKGQFAVIFNDVTPLKEAEAVLSRQKEELVATNAELERFTYTVSHDLKSPLITIKGFLGMLEQDLANGDNAAVKKDIEFVCDAADMMGELLQEILEYSRIGKVAEPSVLVSLTEIADEALELVCGQIRQRGVEITIQRGMPEHIVDRRRLREVFQNLIDNAVKFMADQESPQISIGCKVIDGSTTIFVRDNGIGIENRYLTKVFSLFEQLDPKIPGTGIGLALVRRIIDAHGGTIWIESQGPSLGTTVYFTLTRGKGA